MGGCSWLLPLPQFLCFLLLACFLSGICLCVCSGGEHINMCTILHNTATAQNSNEYIGTAPFSSRFQQRCTLAAELDTPWVTLRMRPPTLPYLMSSDTPSVTSLRRPMGFPRKSTEPRIWAAWLISSCRQETLHSDDLTQTGGSTTVIANLYEPPQLSPINSCTLSSTPLVIFQMDVIELFIISK